MKKFKNKLYNIVPVTAAMSIIPMAGVSATQTNGDKHTKTVGKFSVSNDGSRSIEFNGQQYNSIDDAVDAFLADPSNVSNQVFLGDIDAATVTNEYNSVDLTKLADPRGGVVSKSYKTLGGQVTDNLEQAKKSYLQNARIKWSDAKGNLFDSEAEARNSIISDGNKGTQSVIYYEILDWSRVDENGNPKKVKINPLNSKDLENLKEIAARNCTLGKSFDIGRYDVNPFSAKSTMYEYNDLKGKTNEEVQKLADEAISSISEALADRLWFNAELKVIPKNIGLYTYRKDNYIGSAGPGKPVYGSHYHEENVSIVYKSTGSDPYAPVGLHDVWNEADKLGNQITFPNNLFTDNFNQEWKVNKEGFAPITTQISTKTPILGGQSYTFTLENQNKILNSYNYYWDSSEIYTKYSDVNQKMLKDHDIGFSGQKPNKHVMEFEVEISQKNLDAAKQNDSSRTNSVLEKNKRSFEISVRNMLVDWMKNDWGYDVSIANDIASAIAKEIAPIAERNLFGNEIFSTGAIKSRIQVDDLKSSIKAQLKDKINYFFYEKFGKTLSDILIQLMSNVYQSRDAYATTTTNSVIYTIDYNGSPLFKIDQTVYQDVLNDPNYASNPLPTIKKFLIKNLANEYSTFFSKFVAGLINVSNSYTQTPTSFIFEKNSIDNYATTSGINIGFDPNSSTVPGGIEPSVKKFDESVFGRNNITTDKLQHQLNRRKDDDLNLLNTQYGTFDSIYWYNQELQEYLSNPNLNEAQIANINQNALTDLNNVVVLYNKDKTPQQARYGEFVDYGYKFNESLSDSNSGVKVLSSLEERSYELNIEGLTDPAKWYLFYDYNGEIILKQQINPIDGSYELGEQQAFEAALKKVVVPENNDWVYYTDNATGTKKVVKNIWTDLYVLNVTSDSGRKYSYGFKTYDDLRNYTTDYITLASVGGGGSITPTPPITDPTLSASATTAALNGFYTSVALIVILEIAFLTSLFVAKQRKVYAYNPNLSDKSQTNSKPKENVSTTTNKVKYNF